MKTLFNLFLILFFLIMSCSGDMQQDIVGKWRVTDMKVELKNVPEQLIENAKTLALVTSYEFKNEGRYSMTISKNTLEPGRKHKGTMHLDLGNKQLLLTTDTLLFENEDDWKLVEPNQFNASLFKPQKMKIEKITSNQLTLSQKENGGRIYYTLEKVLD